MESSTGESSSHVACQCDSNQFGSSNCDNGIVYHPPAMSTHNDHASPTGTMARVAFPVLVLFMLASCVFPCTAALDHSQHALKWPSPPHGSPNTSTSQDMGSSVSNSTFAWPVESTRPIVVRRGKRSAHRSSQQHGASMLPLESNVNRINQNTNATNANTSTAKQHRRKSRCTAAVCKCGRPYIRAHRFVRLYSSGADLSASICALRNSFYSCLKRLKGTSQQDEEHDDQEDEAQKLQRLLGGGKRRKKKHFDVKLANTIWDSRFCIKSKE